MTNDGGVVNSESTKTAERVLLQRIFIYNLLSQGVSVTLLQGAQYRDSKVGTLIGGLQETHESAIPLQIMSFVFEQRLDSDPKSRFTKVFWLAVSNATSSLSAEEGRLRLNNTPSTLLSSHSIGYQEAPARLLRNLAATDILQRAHHSTFLQIFVAHMLYLPQLDLNERARPAVHLDSKLQDDLTDVFLPRVFLALENLVSPSIVDGRVFAALLNAILIAQDTSLSNLLGDEISSQVDALWQSHNLLPADYAALHRQFLACDEVQVSSSSGQPPLSLLPFSHPVFDEELAPLQLNTDEENDGEEASHLEFNTLYSDTQHWHNHKRAILPTHLGGSHPMGPMTDWQKKKQLRSEQRFMSKLQWQAETLTGALGIPLQQTAIPSAKSRSASAPKAEVCFTL